MKTVTTTVPLSHQPRGKKSNEPATTPTVPTTVITSGLTPRCASRRPGGAIALLKASALVYFLGLIAQQRELFQVGRDLNAQTGNLSPLVAAGLFYLILTIPLTHLVNYIDARLRRGRGAREPDKPPAVATWTFSPEMT